MKAIQIGAAIAGLAATAALVAYFGAGAVLQTLSAIGWLGFGGICAIHLGLIGLMGAAWGLLVPSAPLWVFLWGRLIRDAGSEVLPFSQLGGCVLGVRAVALAGVPGTIGTASTIADLTLEFFAKLAYTGLGLAWLAKLRPQAAIAAPIMIGLAAMAIAAIALLLVQRRGFNVFDRFARLLGRGWADRGAAGAAAVHQALAQTYFRRWGLWGGFWLHLACWVASAVEVWVALRLAGMPLPFGVVMVMESLVYAIRTVAFAIPNAVGVERAYILLGAGFGLTPDVALAVSLLKRARDLAIGLPAIGVWQLVEAGRLWRRPAKPAASS